jgi:hypothetical protein
MTTKARNRSLYILPGAAAALVAALLLLPGGAAAQHRHDSTSFNDDWDHWGDWGDLNWTLLEMQRESTASQEEMSREAGRSRRRDEVEKEQDKAAQEHQAYFDAIIEASQAALKAPAGVYYRKPGYTSAEPPAVGAAVVEAGGMPYLYDRGIFWLQQGAEYLVVTAPAGAVVDKLPQGASRVAARQGTLWYFFGTFFAQKGAAFEVVPPPAGATVFYLPDGYTRDKLQGADVYRFGDTIFKPVFIQGVLAYQVVTP